MEALSNVTPVNNCNAPAEPGEEWRDIIDERLEKGSYQVSNYGRIRNAKRNRLIKLCITYTGYYVAYIRGYNSTNVALSVHRAVAKAFLPPPEREDQTCIDHIDCNRLNNRIENLRWVSYKENSRNPSTLNKIIEQTRKAAKRREHVIICDQFPEPFESAEVLAKLIGVSAETVRYGCRHNKIIGKGGPWGTNPGYTVRYVPNNYELAKPVVTLQDAISVARGFDDVDISKPVWCVEDELPFPSVKEASRLYKTSDMNITLHCERSAQGIARLNSPCLQGTKHFEWLDRDAYLDWVKRYAPDALS